MIKDTKTNNRHWNLKGSKGEKMQWNLILLRIGWWNENDVCVGLCTNKSTNQSPKQPKQKNPHIRTKCRCSCSRCDTWDLVLPQLIVLVGLLHRLDGCVVDLPQPLQSRCRMRMKSGKEVQEKHVRQDICFCLCSPNLLLWNLIQYFPLKKKKIILVDDFLLVDDFFFL